MLKFEINGKEYSMVNNYQEMNLDKLMRFNALTKPKDENDLESFLGIISILCDSEPSELEDMNLTLLNELIENIGFLNGDIPKIEDDIVNIDGIDYILNKDMSKITMGEYSSIKMIQESSALSGGSDWSYVPKMLAILVRPGKKMIHNETGKERWMQDKLDVEDLEYRSELFRRKLMVPAVMSTVNFFLGMKKI